MRKLRRILIVLLLVAVVAIFGASFYLAGLTAEPRGNTLDEEEAWERDHGLWEDFDQLPQESYTVQSVGADGNGAIGADAADEGSYTIHCTYIPAATKSDRYVIISHGFRANRYGAVKYVSSYRDLGFNCIIYDVRAHGEDTPTTCTLGQYESRDLLALIDDAYTRYGNAILLGLHGESMGSAISLSALAYQPRVAFVVADCGFANLYDLLKSGYDQMHLGWLIGPVNVATQARYGFNLRNTSPVGALAGNEVPLCIIHGADDPYITPDNADRLAAATAGYVEVHKVDRAGHAESREVLGREGYEQIIMGFLATAKLA
ncbi:MAG: alpha/beta fold hydrolase [Olegusella sp.]|nr:alpha/beta fold hydrolase [Olegusella sp.]